MSTSKSNCERANRAIETMRRRGKPPLFDTSTLQGRVEKHAYKAASAAVARARKNGLPCDEAWMLQSHLLIADQHYRCKITNLDFDVDNYKTEGAGGTHRAPSPDQIVAGMGYVLGNVRWVLWAVNRAKGEMEEKDFVEICRQVAAHHVEK